MKRMARIHRDTAETRIRLALSLDDPFEESAGGLVQEESPPDIPPDSFAGRPDAMPEISRIRTGIGLFDHMLHLTAFWAGFDLRLVCEGDRHVDAHHSMEDTGLCLGQALREALGDRAGIARTGFARVPMDEALAEVAIDLSGRSWLVWRGDELLPPVLAGEERDVWREYYKSLAAGAGMNLHVSFLYGKNGHHLLESVAKGLGLALSQAVAVDERKKRVRSTKGSLDL